MPIPASLALGMMQQSTGDKLFFSSRSGGSESLRRRRGSGSWSQSPCSPENVHCSFITYPWGRRVAGQQGGASLGEDFRVSCEKDPGQETDQGHVGDDQEDVAQQGEGRDPADVRLRILLSRNMAFRSGRK